VLGLVEVSAVVLDHRELRERACLGRPLVAAARSSIRRA
jgi:hypothetical protein